MDSTLFDYKNYSNEAPRVAPRSNSKNQRPTSAQVSKFNYTAPFPAFHDPHQVGLAPPMGGIGINRNRPTTSGNQYMVPSEEVSRNIPHGMIEELEPEEEARLAEKAVYGEQLQLPGMQKLMPRNIKVEKEKLYEDTLHLKQNINTLKEDNVKLKTKNLGLERENAKLVKTLEKMGSASAHYGKPAESALLVALKKQVKETKEELKLKNDEVESMKRSTKFTKVQELEIELRAYTDENIRLKNMFEELMRAKPQINPEDYNALEERYYMQVNLIETLQRDHARLSAEAKHIEDENYSLKMGREQDAKNAQKQQAEMSRLRKQLKEKELKAVPNYSKLDSSQRAALLRPDDKSRTEDDIEVKRQVEQKNQIISQKDRTIEELKQQLNEKMSYDMRERQNHTSEMLKMKEQYAELESKYRAMLGVHGESEKKKTGDTSHTKETDPDYRATPQHGKKLKRVSLEEVKGAGYELSLKLRIRCIPLDDVMKYLSKSGPKISVSDMKNMLTHDPFGIKDENNAILMARFLIESQEEETISFDINRAQDVGTIKNLFKKLVGSYSLLQEEDEKAMGEELSELLHNYEESLKTQLMMMPGAKTGYLSSDEIANAFELLEIEIDPNTFEYLIMNIYEYTGNLKRLDYMRMFEIFETEEHKKMKKIVEMYQGEEEYETERSDKKVKFQDTQGQGNKGKVQANKAPQANKQQKEEEDYEDEYPEDEEEEEYGEDEYEEDNDQ